MRKRSVSSPSHALQRNKQDEGRKRDGGDSGIAITFPTLGDDFADTTFENGKLMKMSIFFLRHFEYRIYR